jgi:tRNA (adenine57-N1/adenine58-N1)-methyltransferase
MGETVLLVDPKRRRYLITLEAGGQFHSHAGFLPHEELVGQPDGSAVTTTQGQSFVAWRPTLSDYILKMPRGAQVIYPKDLGPMLMLADVSPGLRVLESGVGSGALSMALLRAGADVTGYELREDFAARAVSNVGRMLGPAALERYAVQLRDCYEGIDGDAFDRIILDLPEPWRVVEHAAGALRPGGILLSYTPSVIQVTRLRNELNGAGFALAETLEVLNRTWHVEDPAVRPDHRMVAHTGFLTHARRLNEG